MTLYLGYRFRYLTPDVIPADKPNNDAATITDLPPNALTNSTAAQTIQDSGAEVNDLGVISPNTSR